MESEQKAKIFEYAKRTTAMAKETDVLGYLRDRKGTSPATLDGYRRLARSRIDGKGMSGVSARSFHQTRAALLFTAAERFKEARKVYDEAMKREDGREAVTAARTAREAVQAFREAQVAEKPLERRQSASKRRSLPRGRVWQGEAFQKATEAQRPGIAVIWATGARPAEIETGVHLERSMLTNGKIVIIATIQGAKVTDQAGQPERRIFIDPESEGGMAVEAIMNGQPEMTVRRGAKRLNKDCEAIRGRGGPKVSPYSFRHQVGADLKAANGESGRDVTAMALGHVTTRMQGRYGSVRQGRAGAILGAEAVRVVRVTARPERAPELADVPSVG